MNREHGVRVRARMVRKALALALAAALSPLAAGPLTARAAGLSVGDVLAGGVGGRIFHFDPHGKLLNVLDTQTENAGNAPSQESGMCFDAALDLFTTNNSAASVSKFDSQGNLVTSSWAGNFNVHPESCARDSAGNVYVGSIAPGDLRKFSPTGTLLAIDAPSAPSLGVGWIDLAADGCTLYYTSGTASILRYNVCTAAQLADFADKIPTTCNALRIRPSGEVLAACGAAVDRFSSSGTLIQSYSTASFNQEQAFQLDLDIDGTSFWLTDGLAGDLDKVDIETGRVLFQVQTSAALNSVAIVPGPPQPNPPVAASLPPVQAELVVCGNAPVSGLPSASSTPCVRTLGSAVLNGNSVTVSGTTGGASAGATATVGGSTVTGVASSYTTSGGVTVAGRGVPPNISLQVQYVPAGSTVLCGAQFWSASNPPSPGAGILGTLTADGSGNFASPGVLPLPSPAPLGQAQICVVEPQPPSPQTMPAGSYTVPLTVASGSGPGSCLQSASTGHNGFTVAGGQGAWWNGDPGVAGPTGGVYAKIAEYNPFTAAGVGDVTSSTMIYAPSTAGVVQTAQTGWTKGDLHFPPGTPPQQFAEYVDSTAGVDVFLSGVSGATVPTGTTQQAGALGTAVVGDSEYYATTFDPTTQLTNALGVTAPGEFNFYVNNTLVAAIPGTFSPSDTHVGTTVHAGTDQIAGGVNDHEHFSDVYAYEPAGQPSSGSATQRWHSFDQQAVTKVVTSLVAGYAQTSAGNPAAGTTVDAWDSTCSM